jgi:molybdopterin converting factor small subunit
MGADRMDFSFEGDTLGKLLETLFYHYRLRELIVDEGGDVLPWSRLAVNGRFSYLIGDMSAEVRDGDTVALIRPYAVAF